MTEIAHHPTQHVAERVHRIVLPKPPIGAKCHVIGSKGLFVLEEGPGNYLHTVCTHAGSGHVEIYDGVVEGTRVLGRKLFRAAPMAMGVWHLNAGFQHGLVIDAGGGHESIGAQFSAVWYGKSDLTRDSVSFPNRETYDLATAKGRHILTTRDALLYSVVIGVQGSGRFALYDGEGRKLYGMPSSFTGSFLLEHVFARGGIVLEVDYTVAPAITFTWLEREHVEPLSTEREDGRRAAAPEPAAPRTSAPGPGPAGSGTSITAAGLATDAPRTPAAGSPSATVNADGVARQGVARGGEAGGDEGGARRSEPPRSPPATRRERRR